jgi:hypothetical protein
MSPIDWICGLVWAWHRARVLRAEAEAKRGTWRKVEEAIAVQDAPTEIGRGAVKWSARGA